MSHDSLLFICLIILLNEQFTWSQCSEQTEQGQVRVPYQMIQGLNQQASNTDNWRLLMLAPYATVRTETDVWEMPNLPENQRHAFAVRTCSGCHSKEGAAPGFHIAPAMAGQPAQLSAFLTGRGNNSFTKNGATYTYNTLNVRRELLKKYLDETGEIFEGLLLPEFAH